MKAEVELNKDQLADLVVLCEDRVLACEFILATETDPKGVEIAEESRTRWVATMAALTAALSEITERRLAERQRTLDFWRNQPTL